MIGRYPQKRKPGSKIHSFVSGNDLERNQTLVVVHSQNGIVAPVIARSKKSVGREGPVDMLTLSPPVADNRPDYRLLFLSQLSVQQCGAGPDQTDLSEPTPPAGGDPE